MPLSPIYDFGTPLDRVKTYDGQSPFTAPGHHMHIHIGDADVQEPLGTKISPREEEKPYVRTEPARRVLTPSEPFAETRRQVTPSSVDAPPNTARPLNLRKSPASDAEEEDPPTGEAREVARLEPPPEGCHYALEPRDTGEVAIVIEAGPSPESVGDRRRSPRSADANSRANSLFRQQSASKMRR
jgi:hypothetical protein